MMSGTSFLVAAARLDGWAEVPVLAAGLYHGTPCDIQRARRASWLALQKIVRCWCSLIVNACSKLLRGFIPAHPAAFVAGVFGAVCQNLSTGSFSL